MVVILVVSLGLIKDATTSAASMAILASPTTPIGVTLIDRTFRSLVVYGGTAGSYVGVRMGDGPDDGQVALSEVCAIATADPIIVRPVSESESPVPLAAPKHGVTIVAVVRGLKGAVGINAVIVSAVATTVAIDGRKSYALALLTTALLKIVRMRSA